MTEEKIKKPKTVPINARIPAEIGEKLKAKADKNLRSVTQEVVLALSNHVKSK